LKDASATAVYGVRGANGVIVVTTKVGNTSTKPTITFTANYGVSNPTRIPRYLNSAEYARMTNLASLNDVRTAEFPNGPASFTFPFSDQDIALYENGADPIFHPNTDWMATIIKRNAPQQNYNVNISGGTTKMKYFASLGYFNQVGNFGGLQVFKNVPVNGNLNRYNIRLNTDFEWTKKFSTSFKFATQITEGYNTNIVIGSANMLHHIFSLNPLVSVPYIDGKIINNAPELAGYEISANPLKQYNGSYSLQYQARTTIDFSTEYKLDDITKGLSVKGKFAYDNLYSLRSNRSRTTPGYDLIRTAPGYTGDYYTFVQTSFEGPFSSNENYSSNYRLYSEASLNYNRNFYRSHKVGALLLGTMERWYRGGNPALPFNYMGIVGRATYNFRDKYLAEFNMGYNGSENFAKGKQFGFFPAYSLGYVISEEEFFPQDFFISFLKIRGSQGKVGNDKVSNTRFLYTPSSYELVNAGSGTIRFGESNTTPDGMYREAKIGNPDVTWEVATKSNIGFEMKLFNDRFSFATDLFSENREGILGNYNNVPMTFGNLSLLPSYNLGVVKNAGYEFEVGYRSSKRRKLQFWVNANYSFARNEIVYNDEIPPEYPNLIRTGKPIGQPFMYTTNGYYNSWEEVNDPNRTRTKWDQNVQPGDLKFVDLTGDNFVDENDLSAIGYGQVPEITYGLNFGVRYSGFDLSALIQGVDNVSNYYSTPIIMRIKWSARTEADFFAWTEERYKNGQEIRYPRVGNGGASANNMENSYQNLDASYVRLKNLEFGYAINKSTVKKLGLDGLRFYISGQNLLLFSKMEYWDPESARGTDRQYPVTRVVNFGAKANF
jgi:TonB-linked SusC/RagA family outer membrane protein